LHSSATKERSRAKGLTPLLALILALCVCSEAAAACPSDGEGFAHLATAEAEIAYRWEPREIKVGQFFEAEVVACRARGAGAINRIVIDAQMPAHGHGMNYRPKATRAGPDRFRFTGLMLHMAGAWQLTFDVFQGETRTRLSQELNLKP
jgi:hypothetical protein